MKPVSSGEASEEGCDMASEADRMKIIVAAIKNIIFFLMSSAPVYRSATQRRKIIKVFSLIKIFPEIPAGLRGSKSGAMAATTFKLRPQAL
ncbi:MAG TPA: hypothetical protein PKK92_09550 [Methanothrix sp.]|jgi:hypothetical protein|nr:hypothetical protein [Methanothrix sp.]